MFYVPVGRLGAGDPTKNTIGSLLPALGAHYSEKIYYICTFENGGMGVIVIVAFLFLKLWRMCSFLLLIEKGKLIVTCPQAGTLHLSLLALWH